MFMLGIALLSSTLAAGPSPLVALSRRGGVSAPKAMSLAQQVSDTLVGVPLTRPLEDFTSCRSKKVCLLTSARKAGATVLISIEVSSVLDDGSLRVEAWSIDDDGARIGEVLVEGALATLVAKAAPSLSGTFSAAVRTTLGLTPPPAPGVEPQVTAPPVVKVPQPAPRPVLVTTPTPAQPFFTTGRLVGGSVAAAGTAALLVASVLGGLALDASSKSQARCAPATPCSDLSAFTEYLRAARSQNAAVALTVSGVAALALGAIVFVVNPGAGPVTVSPASGGAAASFAW
ncbi:MAG: hypothetical protein JNM69_31440 [Archangium sp.]|nr:hypothetical protein [Archangium sp.]